MKYTTVKKMQERLLVCFETAAQYFWITLELFNKHGLTNHAAAGAYGFLFSAAPALLIVSFFVSKMLASSPEIVLTLIGQIGLLSKAFDMHTLTAAFLAASKPGIAGFVSIIGLLWTAHIFAMSLQRGLGVIFPDTVTPFKTILISAGIEVSIILFTFIVVLSSETAFLMYRALRVFPFPWFMEGILTRVLPVMVLGCLIFGAYMLVPANAPTRTAAFRGTLFCILCFIVLLLGSRFVFNPAKYNIVYGTLGNLIILLADVYFFFIFFFLGAELTYIIHFFDVFLMSRFIQTHAEETPSRPAFERRFFMSTRGALKKYLHYYEKGTVLFYKGDSSQEVYYILSGEVAVYLDDAVILAVIKQGNFFGEMGHLLAKGRSATIKAHTDLETLVIPSALFQNILKNNAATDRKVIEILSERLRDVNEKLMTEGSAVLPKTVEEKEF